LAKENDNVSTKMSMDGVKMSTRRGGEGTRKLDKENL
jgi:hypothetical protein